MIKERIESRTKTSLEQNVKTKATSTKTSSGILLASLVLGLGALAFASTKVTPSFVPVEEEFEFVTMSKSYGGLFLVCKNQKLYFYHSDSFDYISSEINEFPIESINKVGRQNLINMILTKIKAQKELVDASKKLYSENCIIYRINNLVIIKLNNRTLHLNGLEEFDEYINIPPYAENIKRLGKENILKVLTYEFNQIKKENEIKN